ncbi:MAG TPA: glycosyltransferase family 9 protein [bacterium]|nr:glycosyltransferase family 9 protein [bacterium]
MKRILVVKLSSMGDTLLSAPVFEAVRAGFPQARVTVLVEPYLHELFLHSRWADEVLAYSSEGLWQRGFLLRAWRTGRFLTGLQKRHFDLALDLTGSAASSRLVSQCGAGLRIGPGLPGLNASYDHLVPLPAGRKRTSYETDLFMARALGLAPRPLERSGGIWNVPDEARSFAETFWKANRFSAQDMVVALNPFAAYPTREWYPSKWAMVIRELDANGVKTFLTCLPAQKDRLQEIEKQAGPSLPSYSGRGVLPLLALYQKSALWVGVNAAYRHLAAGVGAPTLTLWGPDPIQKDHPYSIERHPQVLKEVPCRPCRLTVCVDKKHECMVALQPEDVLKAIKRSLKSLVRS